MSAEVLRLPSGDDGRRQAMSLDRKLPLLIAALLVVIFGVGAGLAYYEVGRVSELAAFERLRRVSHQLAGLLETSVAVRADSLEQVARSGAIRAALESHGALTPAQSDRARAALSRLSIPADSGLPVELWTMRRTRLLSVGADTSAASDRADPFHPMLERGVRARSDSARFGPLYAAGGRVFFWTWMPVKSEGGTQLGWIAQQRRIAVSRTAERQVTGLIGDRSSVYLRDTSGTFWTTLGGVPTTAPKAVTSSLKSPLGALGDTITYVRPGSVGRVLSAQATIGGTPWAVVLEVAQSAVHASVETMVKKFVLLSSLLVLVGALAAWLISRRLTRPIAALTAASSAMARGDYGHRVSARGRDELARLASSFNAMAAEVASAHMELERARDDAEHQRQIADEARSTAVAASRAKSDFLATMSHEIRTPINAVLGYTELLELGLSGPLTTEQRAQLERIHSSTQHLLGLVNEVLDLAKIESGTLRVDMAQAKTSETVEAALSLIKPQAALRGITLNNQCRDGPSYLGDEHRVRQALANLLSNAVKFSNPGGDVEVACSSSEQPPAGTALATHIRYVAISVTDFGIGIAPEYLDRIFQPFVQAERAERSTYTRERSGTGLGLSISRQLANLMGGEITVESTPGKGSTFTLWIPTAESRQRARGHVRAAIAQTLPSGPAIPMLAAGASSVGKIVSQKDALLVPEAASTGDATAQLARHQHGFEAISEMLMTQLCTILRTWGDRMRESPAIPRAREVTAQQLDDHAATLLTDIALTLSVIGSAGDDPAERLRAGTAIQQVVAEQHGMQRYQLGWTEAAIEAETGLMDEIVEAMIRRMDVQDAEAIESACAAVDQLIEHATRLSLRSYRAALEADTP